MARWKVWVKGYGTETVVADKCERYVAEYVFKKGRRNIVARFPMEAVISVRKEAETPVAGA